VYLSLGSVADANAEREGPRRYRREVVFATLSPARRLKECGEGAFKLLARELKDPVIASQDAEAVAWGEAFNDAPDEQQTGR